MPTHTPCSHFLIRHATIPLLLHTYIFVLRCVTLSSPIHDALLSHIRAPVANAISIFAILHFCCVRSEAMSSSQHDWEPERFPACRTRLAWQTLYMLYIYSIIALVAARSTTYTHTHRLSVHYKPGVQTHTGNKFGNFLFGGGINLNNI